MFDHVIPGIFWLGLIAAAVAAAIAFVKRTPGWFFLTACIFWGVSSLAAWSIGWMILALAFIFFVLGVACFLRWDHPWQMMVAALAGLLFWWVSISWLKDNLWVLWPWLLFL